MNPGGLINGSWLLIEALIAQHDHADEWLRAHPLSGHCHILEVISVYSGIMSL